MYHTKFKLHTNKIDQKLQLLHGAFLVITVIIVVIINSQ